MKLWLDDTRRAPPGWVWARTLDQAVALLREGVALASLDHDLGAAYASAHDADICFGGEGCGFCNPDMGPEVERNLGHKEQTGYDVVLWMAENEIWPTEGIVIHSWNPVGAKNMAAVVDRYGPYDTPCRCIPWDPPT